MTYLPFLPLRLSLAAVFAALLGAAQGATLNYNPGQNLGWFNVNSTQWGVTPPTYNINWTSGDSAIIGNSGNLTSYQLPLTAAPRWEM